MYIQSIQIAMTSNYMCASQTIAYSCYPYDPRIIASIHAGCFSNNIEFQVEWCCILFSIYSARKAKCLHAPSSKYRLEMHILNTPLYRIVCIAYLKICISKHTHTTTRYRTTTGVCVCVALKNENVEVYIYIYIHVL